MLSILIPTYNYNVFPLADALAKQATENNIDFEIICIDDGSKSKLNTENEKINALKNGTFTANSNNVGRVQNRQNLALKAKYNTLLFLDADTFPKSPKFLHTFLQAIKKNPNTVLFGGFAYKKESLTPVCSLRYTFGKKREEVLASKRNSKPYKTTISANFCIEKQLFLDLNSIETSNRYGLDYLFGVFLKEKQIKVLHLDNAVYHLGLDTNIKFLEKSLKAVETLSYIQKKYNITSHDISLLKIYSMLRYFGLQNIVKWVVSIFKKVIKSNLFSQNPSLRVFDLYRLYHFISIH